MKTPLKYLCLALLAATATSHAAAVIWNGTNGVTVTTNWSDSANWLSAIPAGGDDVKFNDNGAVAAVSNINNVVDASFGGFIGTLQYGNTNNNHTTLIPAGVTLSVTNTNASSYVLIAGTLTDNGSAQVINATIAGQGTLSVSNTNGIVVVDQGRAANGNGTQRATLDMTGLDNVNWTVNRIGVGTASFGGANNAQNATGTLRLGRTNVITTAFTVANFGLNTATPTNAVEIGGNNGNAGGTAFFYLGQTNAFFIDSIGVGKLKQAATMLFGPSFVSPAASFRGPAGAADRVKFWTIGDMWSSGSSSSQCTATNDFTGGTVDAKVDVMSLGRDRIGGNTGANPTVGTLIYTAGTFDVNTLKIGNQEGTTTGNSNPMVGIVTLNGASATLVVNTSLILGNTTVSSTAAQRTTGTLNVRDGAARANSISKGANSTNCLVTLTNATLTITNTMGTAVQAITTLNTTNSTLQLFVAASPATNVCVTNLVTGGATNVIQILSVPVFVSYPKQIPLVSYAAAAIGGVGYNFGLGSTTLPATAPGGSLSNNVANKTIDLYLPFDPRPVITANPSSYSGAPGDNVNFSVTVDPNSVTPLSYQWYKNGVAVTDGATGNTSTISGSTSSTLSITGAQPGDNASLPGYSCTVTNVYGSASSGAATLTIGTGDIAPNIAGPTNQTAIASNNATIVASVAGSPFPTIRWQLNGTDLSDGSTGNGDTIAGSGTSTLTITSVQYPSSQGTYSIIASNAAGEATNSMTLTVIVRPSISAQPTNLTVQAGNSATFYVTASGVPAPGYTWKKNGSPISGATASSYTIASVAASDIATYSVTVTNAAGTQDSSNATLIVTSPMTASMLAPANGATGVCYDTPLYVTFSQSPVLRNSGKIKIFDASNPSTPVETIDLSLNSGGGTQARSLFPGDAQLFNYYPVVITGNTAAIYPHSASGLLTSNKTYYVTVDVGAFADTSGNYFAGINDSTTWSFTTKPSGAADPANPVVNGDGSADFVTVQGALDSLSSPTGPLRRTITVRNGTYFEIVNVGKTNVTIRGQTRGGTFIKYPNNASIAPSGTTHARMTFKVNANDVGIENLTITNSTPQGGSQAEALMIESSAKRCIVNNTEIASRQDTILANVNSSQAYFYNCKVVGNFDYIWGGGNLFFSNCVIRTISGASGFNLTAARTDTSGSTSANFPWQNPSGTFTANGFSLVGCRFETDTGLGNVTLAGSNGTSNNLVSWAYCKFETNYVTPSASLFNGSFIFWQYNNTDLAGNNPVSFSALTTIGITNNDPRLLAATNLTTWFYGWTPQLAPNILTNPANQTVSQGQTAAFTVSATGIPEPSYQWLKNGSPIAGATDSGYTIASCVRSNAGSYSVIVSNVAGSVTSTSATLTYSGNVAPVANDDSFTRYSGTSIKIRISDLLTNDTDADNDTLTLAGFTSSSTNGASVTTDGTFLYLGPNTVADALTYTNSDGFGGTAFATVAISVVPAPPVQGTSVVVTGSVATVSFAGIPNLQYEVQRATNVDFSGTLRLWTTNAPNNGIWSVDDDFSDLAGPPSQAYYRLRYNP